MRALHVFLILSLSAAVSACTRAPTDELLRADLQTLVDSRFAPGLLEVTSARRTRLVPFVLAGADVRIAFDAALRLKRDHRFGAWDEANIVTLALLLDAASGDIHGVLPKGNVAGDSISIHGRLPYIAAGGELKLLAAPPSPTAETERGLVLLSDLKAAVSDRWQSFKDDMRTSKIGIALDEWRTARREIVGRSARSRGGYAVASGVDGTADWQLARAAERAADEQGIGFANIAVSGSQEALEFLRGGSVSAAIVRNTEAALAVSAAPPFEASGPYHLMALAALYPQPVHVVVKENSPIGSPAELFGKHVGVAGTARVDAAEAEAILRAHGVPLGSLAAPLMAVPAADALHQLEAGAFDALIMTAALPSPSLHSFAAGYPIRLLPFDSDAIAFLTTGVANYAAITVPARTYPGQARPLAAVAAVAMLVSVETVPAQEAAGLLDLMLNRVDYLRLGSSAGALVSPLEGDRAMALPRHPGAKAAFEPGPRN